jgi:hypothetical protein
MWKICKNCGKEFECYDKPRKGRKTESKRSFIAVNCSPKCSREWYRKKYER